MSLQGIARITSGTDGVSSDIEVAVTTVTNGVNSNVLFNNNGVLGGYGVSSTETGSTIAIRNGSGNSGFNNVIQGVNLIISTGGQTTFTAASPYNEIVTGSSSHTIQLPDETTLTAGTSFAIYNQSAQQITVRDSAANPLFYMDSGEGMVYLSMSSASATGNWLLTPLLSENITGSTSTLSTNGNLYVGGHAILEGVTSAGSTGTGNLVFSASPALTGTPTAPTPASSDNSTKMATTAYVTTAVSNLNLNSNFPSQAVENANNTLQAGSNAAVVFLASAPVTATYQFIGYNNVTTAGTGIAAVAYSISWTDETNTVQTAQLGSSIPLTTNHQYSVFSIGAIRAMVGTAITVSSTFTAGTGSPKWDDGGVIARISSN